MSSNNSIRLNKYISESGICSRREADKFIEQGHVLINGKRAKVGDKVRVGQTVIVNGNIIERKEKENDILIAFNKPVGVTTTTESNVRDNIVHYVNHSSRVFPIGRLDKDSQGLIFLTNNGDIVNKILRAGNNHEKEYLVTVDKPITDQFISGMASGVSIPIDNEMRTTKQCKVEKITPLVFNITLIQGLNRQIRKMAEHFGYEVVKLERIRIMNVKLKGLPIGEWRDLTADELKDINLAIEKSSSENKNPKKATGNPSTKKKKNSKPSKKSNKPTEPSPFSSKGERKKHFLKKKKFKNNGSNKRSHGPKSKFR